MSSLIVLLTSVLCSSAFSSDQEQLEIKDNPNKIIAHCAKKRSQSTPLNSIFNHPYGENLKQLSHKRNRNEEYAQALGCQQIYGYLEAWNPEPGSKFQDVSLYEAIMKDTDNEINVIPIIANPTSKSFQRVMVKYKNKEGINRIIDIQLTDRRCKAESYFLDEDKPNADKTYILKHTYFYGSSQDEQDYYITIDGTEYFYGDDYFTYNAFILKDGKKFDPEQGPQGLRAVKRDGIRLSIINDFSNQQQ